jgi:hypothetical protein
MWCALKAMFSCSLIVLLVAVPHVSSADFFPLEDLASPHGASFRKKIKISDNLSYEIGRVCVDGPYYDGLPESNVILIRKQKGPNFRGPDDVLTLLVKKELRLFGFSSSNESLYAFYKRQYGAENIIKYIVVFSPGETTGRIVGPSGDFWYGSPSPDGAYCILEPFGGGKIIAVDLAHGTSAEIDVTENSGNNIADSRWDLKGAAISAYFGDSKGDCIYTKMFWSTARSGNLVTWDCSKKVIDELPLLIK